MNSVKSFVRWSPSGKNTQQDIKTDSTCKISSMDFFYLRGGAHLVKNIPQDIEMDSTCAIQVLYYLIKSRGGAHLVNESFGFVKGAIWVDSSPAAKNDNNGWILPSAALRSE